MMSEKCVVSGATPAGVRQTRPVLRWIVPIAVLLALVAMMTVLSPRRAQAAPAGSSYSKWDESITLTSEGDMHVVITMTYDLGPSSGHGPSVSLVTRQGYGTDGKFDRSYPLEDVTASSDTAPADVSVEDADGGSTIYIGDPDQTITGAHTYVLSFTQRGVVNTNTDGSHDEFNWNIFSDMVAVPMSNLTATVTGPAAATDALCFSGPVNSTTPCTATSIDDSGTAHFSQASISPGQAWTVLAQYPLGTFPNAEKILIENPTVANQLGLNPLGIGGAAVVLVGGVFLAIWRWRVRGRDRYYAGLTPGLYPVAGQSADVVVGGPAPEVTVRFTPPDGILPGEAGVIQDFRADTEDVTATIIDLAVRGYIRIVETEAPGKWGGGDWRLDLMREPGPELVDYELVLLNELFAGRNTVLMSQLKTTFAASMGKIKGLLSSVSTQRGWFVGNPTAIRAKWGVLGVFMIIAGIAGVILLVSASLGYALIPIALAVVGVVVLMMSSAATARSADGSAAYQQVKGFELYLTTAEAGQIQFEEGQDIFSRYLPYAIVFGVAERWTAIFAQLAASGQRLAEPGWYVSPYSNPGMFWMSAALFNHSLNSFQMTANTALTAPAPSTTGSSGGSGFSGGGFSGGGGGGGGAGGW